MNPCNQLKLQFNIIITHAQDHGHVKIADFYGHKNFGFCEHE